MSTQTPSSPNLKPTYPLPENECFRLNALHGYQILDTPPEKEYDDIVSLASMICDTPIALISLVDTQRQWFKAKVGLEASQTHRDLSFCTHAIMEPQSPLVVEDATQDPRFANNNLVTSEPHIRFYAGLPLNTPCGHSLGTLCVIDRKPRSITEQQIRTLEVLANNIVNLLELRQSNKELSLAIDTVKAANEKLDRFAYIVAHDLRAPIRAIRSLSEFIKEDFSDGQFEEASSNIDQITNKATHLDSMISALLKFSQVENDSANSEVTALPFILQSTYDTLNVSSHYTLTIDESVSNIQCQRMPLQQIFHNLISNAINHHDKPTGSIAISAKANSDFYEFSVTDDGPGIDPKFHEKIFEVFNTYGSDPKHSSTGIGLTLVQKLIEQQGGKIWVTSTPGEGATFSFTWPRL